MGDKVLAIIPARAGSVRVPGKNIKMLDGRPLIAYSILAANASKLIAASCVATDGEAIADAAEAYGAKMIASIPSELATGKATLSGTLRHTLEYVKTFSGMMNDVDWVVLLQPTCPLRQPALLDRWIQTVLDTKCDGGLTVDREGFKLGYIDFRVTYIPDYEPMTPKAQASRKWGRENGVFYMFRTKNVLKGKPFDGRMIPLENPPEQSIANIDTQLDWDIAEFLYYKKHYKEMFESLEAKHAIN